MQRSCRRGISSRTLNTPAEAPFFTASIASESARSAYPSALALGLADERLEIGFELRSLGSDQRAELLEIGTLANDRDDVCAISHSAGDELHEHEVLDGNDRDAVTDCGIDQGGFELALIRWDRDRVDGHCADHQRNRRMQRHDGAVVDEGLVAHEEIDIPCRTRLTVGTGSDPSRQGVANSSFTEHARGLVHGSSNLRIQELKHRLEVGFSSTTTHSQRHLPTHVRSFARRVRVGQLSTFEPVVEAGRFGAPITVGEELRPHMTTMFITDLARKVPVLVPGASAEEVEKLAARINRYDDTGGFARNPSLDGALNPRDIREASRRISGGGSGLLAKEKALFPAIRVLAELFPNEASAYQYVDLTNGERLSSSKKVAIAELDPAQREVAERLSSDGQKLTLEDYVRGVSTLTWDEKKTASAILEKQFGIAPWKDKPMSGWEDVLPGQQAKAVAKSDLGKGVTISVVEDLYSDHDGSIQTRQALEIRAKPGDVVSTSIGYGSNMGPYMPDKLLTCDQNGVVRIPVRHLYPDRDRIAIVRPAKEPGDAPEVLARADVYSPSRTIKMSAPPDVLTDFEVKAAVRDRVEGPASKMAKRIVMLEQTPMIFSGSARPDLSFRVGKLPAGPKFIEVPLPGHGTMTAHVVADGLPKSHYDLSYAFLTYYLERPGRSEIAGPFYID
jgi:hypothetical protein